MTMTMRIWTTSRTLMYLLMYLTCLYDGIRGLAKFFARSLAASIHYTKTNRVRLSKDFTSC